MSHSKWKLLWIALIVLEFVKEYTSTETYDVEHDPDPKHP